MFVWSKVAGTQPFVVWQSSQVSPLVTCPGCLPVATVPLWQDEHVPMTCVWSTRSTGVQRTVLWQSSQTSLVLI